MICTRPAHDGAHAVISAPFAVTHPAHAMTPEMQAIRQEITGERLGDKSVTDRLSTIAEGASSSIGSESEHSSHYASNLLEIRPLSPPPPRSRPLRSSTSSPNLRLTPSVPALRPRSKSPQPSHLHSTFCNHRRRPLVRAVLDAIGCTTSENFRESDFARVSPPDPKVDLVPTGTEPSKEESSNEEPSREEPLHELIHRMLYCGVNQPTAVIREI